MKKKENEKLQFIFLPEGFQLDIPEHGLDPGQKKKRSPFEKDRYAALYQMGLEERQDGLSASAAFLYLVSDTFFKSLTSLPELELARDNAEVNIVSEDGKCRAICNWR